MHRRPSSTRLLLALLLAAAFAHAPTGVRADTAAVDPAKIYDQAAELVRENFYDPKLGGLDWRATADRHRAAYVAAKTPAERSAAINALLAELKASHMFHFTPDEPAYYQLLDIFSYGLRNALRRHFGTEDIRYPGIGIFTRSIDGKTFVSGTIAGQAGAKGGLMVGDEIVSVDGGKFEPVASFRDKVGKPVEIVVRRDRDGPELKLAVTPSSIDPGKAFDEAIGAGARVIESNGKRIGYVRLWSYAGYRYQSTLEELLSTGKLKDVDALVWDLRDGWGGAQARFLDLFSPTGPDMTMTERDGTKSYANFKWRKPVALLVNGGSRSGKEVLTYGFKKYGLGPVIGTRTAGALLAGRGFLLDDGTFLMVAVNDVAVDGERLEGLGVEPTIEVPFELPYAAGRDPQLDKAVEMLAGSPRNG